MKLVLPSMILSERLSNRWLVSAVQTDQIPIRLAEEEKRVSSNSSLRIRAATRQDVRLILEFIRELAAYEKHLDRVEATEARIEEAIFGSEAVASVIFAHQDDGPVGFAVFYYAYSTFLARPGLYLEDLYVKPKARGKGVGRELLRYLANLALEQQCCRIEWAVLRWNEPSIGFYKSLGAVETTDWATYRLSGEHLKSLAAGV